ncbi:MAG TPA: hypothetical protein PKE31_11555 [Pseudomonadota bacterium]|nr:hypothetical protein [Pseudomonadota bacterium]
MRSFAHPTVGVCAAVLCGLWASALGSLHAAPLRVIVSFSGRSAPLKPPGYWLWENGVVPAAPPSPDPRQEAVVEVFRARSPTQPTLPVSHAPLLPREQTVFVVGKHLPHRLLLLAPSGALFVENQNTTAVTLELVPALPGLPSISVPPKTRKAVPWPAQGELSFGMPDQPEQRTTVLCPTEYASHLVLGEPRVIGVASFEVATGPYVVKLRLPSSLAWQNTVDVPDGGKELSLTATLGP